MFPFFKAPKDTSTVGIYHKKRLLDGFSHAKWALVDLDVPPDVALPITFQKDQLPSGTESAFVGEDQFQGSGVIKLPFLEV